MPRRKKAENSSTASVPEFETLTAVRNTKTKAAVQRAKGSATVHLYNQSAPLPRQTLGMKELPRDGSACARAERRAVTSGISEEETAARSEMMNMKMAARLEMMKKASAAAMSDAPPPPRRVANAKNWKPFSKIDYPIRKTGFDHLDPEKIMKVLSLERNNRKKIMFLVKWKNMIKPELILNKIMNRRYPFMVIKFYETVINWTD